MEFNEGDILRVYPIIKGITSCQIDIRISKIEYDLLERHLTNKYNKPIRSHFTQYEIHDKSLKVYKNNVRVFTQKTLETLINDGDVFVRVKEKDIEPRSFPICSNYNNTSRHELKTFTANEFSIVLSKEMTDTQIYTLYIEFKYKLNTMNELLRLIKSIRMIYRL